MTAPHADQLIDGYLARIAAAAADFPAAARDELLADIGSHIAEARARAPEETDAGILNILDRLGEPSVVVGEARDRLGLRREITPSTRPGILEVGALVLLIFLYPAGLILLWLSPMWKTADKVIGSVFTLGGILGLFILATTVAHPVSRFLSTGLSSCGAGADSHGNVFTNCSGPSLAAIAGGILQVGLTLGFFLLPMITVVYLAVRLGRARRLVPAVA
jgi:uncharacterized membrane protein